MAQRSPYDARRGCHTGSARRDALPALLRASAHDLDDDQDTFQMIVIDLLERDPERARPTVLELIDTDDAALRSRALWALDFVVADDDLPRLLAALGDPHPDVRSAAAVPVGHLAKRLGEAMDALVAALDDPEPRVRISVLRALGHTRAAAAAPHVARFTNDPDEGVRQWAAIALERLGEATP